MTTTDPLDLDAIEARAEAATPGPWELGSVWLRAGLAFDAAGERVGTGGTHCAYCHHGEPVVAANMDVNGRTMPGHIHHAADLDDLSDTRWISGPPGVTVLVGSDDYGPHLSAADAAFMAHARTDVPALLAEIRRLRAAS